jgi:hypothetical protein
VQPKTNIATETSQRVVLTNIEIPSPDYFGNLKFAELEQRPSIHHTHLRGKISGASSKECDTPVVSSSASVE